MPGQHPAQCLARGDCCAVLSPSGVPDSATPWTAARQAPLSMGIIQARILEWVAMPFSSGSSRPRNQTGVSCIAGRHYAISPRLPVLVILIFKNLSILCATSYLYALSLILENLLLF